jgi:lipoate---protein ligase
MLAIINHQTDPKFNLALEEYVLKYIDTDEDILILWQNEPSIIVGRNQNVYEEINFDFVKKHRIPVIRRITGGGTVYHDLGNLNYSFITSNLKNNLSNYKKFTTPVIDALNQMGVQAEFSGKSDIKISGKKISGNAQSYHKNRMLHHGTLLFDSNLEHLNLALKVKPAFIDSKSVKSNRSDVTNIKPYLRAQISIQDFKNILYQTILNVDQIEKKQIHLTHNDYEIIQELISSKYQLWSWNYGESPDFIYKKEIINHTLINSIELSIESGFIKDIKVSGNISSSDSKIIQSFFKDLKFDLETLKEQYLNHPTVKNAHFQLEHLIHQLFS